MGINKPPVRASQPIERAQNSTLSLQRNYTTLLLHLLTGCCKAAAACCMQIAPALPRLLLAPTLCVTRWQMCCQLKSKLRSNTLRPTHQHVISVITP